MIFWIISQSIHTNFLPLFMSIALTLEENNFKVYFIGANILQKYQLSKYRLKSCKHDSWIIKELKIQKLLIWNGVFHDINIPWVQNYYFENGYFGNDLQIFQKWVNAKSEISSMHYTDILRYSRPQIHQKIIPSKTISELHFSFYSYWILGFFSQNIFKSMKDFWKILKNILENKKRASILKNIHTPNIPEWKYITIGFQVYDDTQILYNSPLIKKMSDILEYFYSDIKEILPGYKIIVKEHPMDIGRVDYSYLRKKYPEIIWIQKWDIWDYINISDYLICVNSSIGLQALSQYKKVMTLWENFYSNNPWVKNIRTQEEFLQKLIELSQQDLKKQQKEIDEYIKVFHKKIFISNGWWKSFNQKTVTSICERLI